MPDAASSGIRSAIVWRSLPLRMAVIAVPAWFTVAVLVFSTTPSEKLLVGFVLALTLASPAHGLLAVTALAPLGHLLGIALGMGSFRLTESLVVAFITGWVVRAPSDRHGPRVPAAIGWLLATAVVASIAAVAGQIGRYPGQLAEAFDLIFHEYYVIEDRIGFMDGARVLEGIALLVGTTTLFRRQPWLAVALPAALTAPAVVAAAASVLLWLRIGPAEEVARAARNGYRFSAHVGDVNAAGSYFAMMICLALGVSLRERGGRRALWIVAAAASLVGLWFSESRSAFAACAIVTALAAAWAAPIRLKTTARVGLLALILLGAIAAGAARVRQLEAGPGYHAADLREQFNATSLRMIEARPMTGVGIGQYYRLSALFLTPQVAFTYRFENAHNYFLQIGAELGIVGLVLFVAWVGVPLTRASRALAERHHDFRLLGAASGVAALLVTCLTGHPLLINEVAIPFWILFGLTGSLAGSTLLDAAAVAGVPIATARAPRALLAAAAAMGVGIVALTLASAARGGINPPQSQAVDGFYEWETGEGGTRFRWTGLYASLFVPADVTRVYMPLRVPTSLPALSPMGVEIVGTGRHTEASVGDSWLILNLELPDAIPPARFKRIDLRVDRTWQPALYLPGSSDFRSVGVQVGECRLFRER